MAKKTNPTDSEDQAQENPSSICLASVTRDITREAAADAVGIAVADVFAFRDYGSHIVVVTIDGRKLNSAELAAERGDV